MLNRWRKRFNSIWCNKYGKITIISVKPTASNNNNSPFLQIKMKALFDPGGTVANGSQWLFVKYFYFHTYYIETESQKTTANMVIKTKHRRYQRFLCLKSVDFFWKEKIILKITVTITIIIIIIIFGNGLR